MPGRRWAPCDFTLERTLELPFASFSRQEGRSIALGGVSLDPHVTFPRVGCVRRLYVRADSRRRGVGRALVDQVIREARRSFSELRLRAGRPEASAFFEALGFEVPHCATATHRHRLR